MNFLFLACTLLQGTKAASINWKLCCLTNGDCSFSASMIQAGSLFLLQGFLPKTNWLLYEAILGQIAFSVEKQCKENKCWFLFFFLIKRYWLGRSGNEKISKLEETN